jgi:hypothetical protein
MSKKKKLTNYQKYRGKCQNLCDKLLKEDPTLTLVRGHYICPQWGPQAHWWCIDTEGNIVDPSVKQFPTEGVGATYVEYDGMVECSECKKKLKEEDALIEGNGNHAFCNSTCYGRYVGIL